MTVYHIVALPEKNQKDNHEAQLKKIIKLPIKLQKDAENLLNLYTWDKIFLNKIKEISKNFGLNFNIKFEVIIISAEKKYLFNYLSWGFADKDPKIIAKKLSKFIYTNKFRDKIQHLSGRAIHDKNIIEKIICSLNELKKLGYPIQKWSFYNEIKSLCDQLLKTLKPNKWVILIGVSSTEKLESFDRLLAHEIFHLVLISNGIWFQWIKEDYDSLDEGLAILLERRYSERKKDIVAWFWEETLMIEKESRIKKIRNLYNDLKKSKFYFSQHYLTSFAITTDFTIHTFLHLARARPYPTSTFCFK